MGIFGWSYPPGCSGPPEHYQHCEVCGRTAESCECPECPACGVAGDPACYANGHIGPMPGRVVPEMEPEPPPPDDYYNDEEPY